MIQVAPKVDVNESLQTTEGSTRIGVAVIIRPPQHHFIYLLFCTNSCGKIGACRLVKHLICRRMFRWAVLLGKM
jgi:hypothetical protein